MGQCASTGGILVSLMELDQFELCPQKELLGIIGANFYRSDVLPVAQPTAWLLADLLNI